MQKSPAAVAPCAYAATLFPLAFPPVKTRIKFPRAAVVRLASAAVILSTLAAPAWAVNDPKASRFYEDALTRYEKREYAAAIVQLKNALQIDSKMLPGQVLLGKALLANGEVVASEVAFTEALRLGVNRAEVVLPLARAVVAQARPQDLMEQPRFATAGLPPGIQLQLMLMRASAAADLGDPRNGLRMIEEARALDPSNADTWLAEIPVRIRSRQIKEAQAAADRALTLAPESAEALYLRGTVSHVQGDIAAALASYDKALRVQPTHTEALVSRAGMLLDAGRLQDAARDVAELLRSSPKEPRGAYMRALLAERQGNTALAKSSLADITALLDQVPLEFLRYRPQALMLGGLAHYSLGEREKSKPYLEAVQRTQPYSPVSKLLAQIYLSEKNTDRAIEALDNYLKGQPGDAQAVRLLASAHMAQGRYARAAQLTQDALKLQDVPDLRTLLGMSLIGTGKMGDAVGELEAALRKDPGQVQAGSTLAMIYMNSGQLAKAIRVAEALVKQSPDNPALLNLLGTAKARSGDAASARAAFEQALKLDGTLAATQVNLARLEIDAKAYDSAAGRLNTVLRTDEKNIDAMTEMARSAEQRGLWSEAQRWLEKADDVSGPNNVQAGLLLVDYHLRNARPDLAREASKRLTNKAPEAMQVLLAMARVNLANADAVAAKSYLTRAASLANYDAPLLVRIALLQLQAGHLPGAAYSLEKALSERPDFLPAQALMAEVDTRQGDFAKAEARAKQIIAKNPKLGVGYGLLGDAAAARGQPALAVDAYRRAHQIEGSSESLLRLYSALSRVDAAAAVQLAEQWVKSKPKDVAVRRALADGYARSGNMAAARAGYEGLLKVAPDDAESLNNLANVMLATGDPAALKTAELALEKRPGAPHIIGTAGWAAFKAGQTDRALQLLRDARLRDPNNPDTRYFLGAVLASAGRKTEAREEIETALKGGRSFASAKDAEKLLQTLK